MLDWKQNDFIFFIGIIYTAFGFMAFYFISNSENLKKKFQIHFGNEQSKIWWIVFQRFCGVLLYGIFPFAIILLNKVCLCQYGLNAGNFSSTLIWIGSLSPIMIIINLLNYNKADNLAMYPQIRKTEWTIQTIVISALSWMAYLFAYEFMFRGFLLFVSLQYLNPWPALALNIAIYALVHVPKGYKEAFGALPLGIALGLITIKTGNIWVAFVVHCVLALSNEWLSLLAQPDMKLIKTKFIK